MSSSTAVSVAAGAAAFALYLHTLAPSITDANGTGDSGELASTAYTLGIAHPTGYPLYTLLGFLVTRLGGEPAHALNLFSAALGALTVSLLCSLCMTLGEGLAPRLPGPLRLLGVVLGVGPFALSSSFWSEATVTETRTLALALDAAILLLLIAPARLTACHVLGATALYGLALGDHLLSLYLAPAVVLLLWPWASGGGVGVRGLLAGLRPRSHDRDGATAGAAVGDSGGREPRSQGVDEGIAIAKGPAPSNPTPLGAGRSFLPEDGSPQLKLLAGWGWAAPAGCWLAGLSTYLYLPIRAAQHPAANWGDPDTLGRFLWVVTGQEYRYQMFGLDWHGYFDRLGTLCDLLRAQLSPLTLLIAAIGVTALAVRRRRAAAALAITFVLDLAATSLYGADAAPSYLLLGMLIVAIGAGAGWQIIMQAGIEWWGGQLGGPATDVARQVRGDCGREDTGPEVLDSTRPKPFVPTRGPQSPARVALVGLICLALGGWAEYPAAGAAHQAVEAADTTTVRDRGVAVLHGLPRRAIIFATGDAASVPLWYAQRGLGMRSDVTIVATALLTFAWYYDEERDLPAFELSRLPPSAAQIDNGTDFSLSEARTQLLARAVRPDRPLFLTLPDPGLTALCPTQLPVGLVYRCGR